MVTMTSAAANKYIKKLNDDIVYLHMLEDEKKRYTLEITSSGDEVSDREEYNFNEYRKSINDINEKIIKLKHAINCINNTTYLPDKDITVDMALVKMAQLNNELYRLGNMRQEKPKRMINSFDSSICDSAKYYTCINYSRDDVVKRYKEVEQEIAEIQMGIDYINQTKQIEIDL